MAERRQEREDARKHADYQRSVRRLRQQENP